MKVLLLSQFFDPEPASIPGMPLARFLQSRGHDVEVVTGFPNYPGGRLYPGYRLKLHSQETDHGVRIHRVPLYPSHDRSSLARLANYGSFAVASATIGTVVTSRQDVTYVYHPPATAALAALFWRRIRAAPFVLHVQDLWPESVVSSGMIRPGVRTLVQSALGAWCNHLYEKAASVAVISPGFKRALVARGVRDEKVHVVYNWAEENLFYPQEPDPALRSALGLDDVFSVVYAGNIGYYQGLDTAIRAASRLRHHPRFRFVIVGDGGALPELRDLATRLQADNVVFLGRQPYREMGRVSALADVLLISLQDLDFFASTVPGKTQVSFACGRPVIMAVRGDAADLVREAGSGIVVCPGDERAMSRAYETMYLMDEADRRAMGARGAEFYRDKLALSEGAGQIEALLQQAVKARRSQGTAGRCRAARAEV
jgi:glycosyltransferase involved in cell wall biosynthesis